MKWKTKKTTWVFLFQKYGKFWSVLRELFFEHKPLISEECPSKIWLVMYTERSKGWRFFSVHNNKKERRDEIWRNFFWLKANFFSAPTAAAYLMGYYRGVNFRRVFKILHPVRQLLEPRDVNSIWPFVQICLLEGFVRNIYPESEKKQIV